MAANAPSSCHTHEIRLGLTLTFRVVTPRWDGFSVIHTTLNLCPWSHITSKVLGTLDQRSLNLGRNYKSTRPTLSRKFICFCVKRTCIHPALVWFEWDVYRQAAFSDKSAHWTPAETQSPHVLDPQVTHITINFYTHAWTVTASNAQIQMHFLSLNSYLLHGKLPICQFLGFCLIVSELWANAWAGLKTLSLSVCIFFFERAKSCSESKMMI